ncbi:hypothetical protein OROMI_007251 [Orobanche minor]
MGIYMAARSIVRLVSPRFSTAGKVVPKGEKIAAGKFPTKEQDVSWEFYEQRRLDAEFKRQGWLMDVGLKLICGFAVVMAMVRSAEIRKAEAKAFGKKNPDNVAAKKLQEA